MSHSCMQTIIYMRSMQEWLVYSLHAGVAATYIIRRVARSPYAGVAHTYIPI